MADMLTLKWGALKGWRVESDALQAAAKKLDEAGGVCASVIMQKRTPEWIEALCGMIDACDGEIWNDWEGDKMTKDEAKKYVREYGR